MERGIELQIESPREFQTMDFIGAYRVKAIVLSPATVRMKRERRSDYSTLYVYRNNIESIIP